MGKARLPDVETREQAGLVDLPFLALSILLTALGLVMIFSASYARALYETGDSAYFFKRQLMFAIVGVAAMLVISRMRPELLRKLAFPVLGVSILFLLLVFVPGIGQSENGATRWVRLGFSFQPSEIAKLGVILSYAAMISAFQEKMETFRWGIMPFGAILLVIIVLLRMEPHNSAIVIITCTAGAMLFLGGVKYRWFVMGGTVMLLGIVVILGAGGYEASRITAWRDPFSIPPTTAIRSSSPSMPSAAAAFWALAWARDGRSTCICPRSITTISSPSPVRNWAWWGPWPFCCCTPC